MQIDDEHVNAVITADKLVDDLARDNLAFAIVALARFHLMTDQRFDLKDFALRRSGRHLYAWYWGDHFLPHSNDCQAQPFVVTSTQVLVIRSAPSFVSATARTYCGSARRIRVDTRAWLRCGTK